MIALPIKDPCANIDDIGIIARTLWGEARGEGIRGMTAVASVIVNRLKANQWKGNGNLRNVCLQREQFSCWNMDDPNRSECLLVNDDDDQYCDALLIAQNTFIGSLKDITNGAHYYFVNGIAWPTWAMGRQPCAYIGKHIFFE